MLTRRVFLRGSAIVTAGMGVAPGWLARAVALRARSARLWSPFSCVAQPTASASWCLSATSGTGKCARLSRCAAPSGQNGGSIDLDGTFALNGAMQPLKALWDKQQLAIVEATGSPDPSRSHFEAQDSMESGTPGKSAGDGWLNRALPAAAGGILAALRAVALTNQVPRTLRGEREAIAVGNLDQFKIGNQDAATIMQSMYATTPDASLGRAGKDAFEAMKVIQAIQTAPQNFRPTPPLPVLPELRVAPLSSGLHRQFRNMARAPNSAAICNNWRA